MLIVKRIFMNSKRLTCYICTSAMSSCDKPPKESPTIDFFPSKEEGSEDKRQQRRKKLEYPEEIVSPEEKKNAKNSLNALLESLSVEVDQKCEDDTDMRDLLKMQIGRKQSKKHYKEKNLGALLYEAADTVAKDLGGDIKKTKADLFDHLRTIEIKEEPEVHEQFPVDGSELRVGTGNTLRALEEVFSSERLGIFEKRSAETGTEVKLNIWERLEKEELAYLAKKPPRNQLEEWISWTEQGKLWQFPIDNDQGMDREAEVEFTQHVFLEEHLEPWCPKKGPLKKFMDLVLVGLSKNPYLTVEDKKEHIFWYRDYFEIKKKLLRELGAFGPTKEIGESDSPLPEQKLTNS